MSFNFGKSKSQSEQQSSQLSPDEIAAYFNKLSDLTGGRLQEFATGGTAPVSYTGPGSVETAGYDGVTPEQIRALGGMGATRTAEVSRARREAVDQITADPNYTLSQRLRATQLTDRDTQDRLDAINKEVEAAITGLSSQEAQRKYESGKAAADTRNTFASEEARRKYAADLTNAGLTAQDLELLSNIYFSGKGQTSYGHSASDAFQIGGGKK